MDEVLFNEQDYDLNGYDENIAEDEMYDDDIYEDEDYYDEDEDIDEDYYDDEDEDEEDEEMGEARGSARARRKRIRKMRKLGYPFSRYPSIIRRPKKTKYFRPRATNKPAKTKNVVKAFNVASRDIQKTKAAVMNVNYKNKRQSKALRSHSKRIKGNEYALAAKTVITELSKEFPIMTSNPLVNVITQSVPGMFHKSKYQKFLQDPKKLTPIIIGAIGLFKEYQERNKKGDGVQNVAVTPPVMGLSVNGSSSFTALAKNANGDTISDKVYKWFSSDPKIATVDANTGNVTGKKLGTVKVYAQESSSGRITSVDVNIT